MRASLYQPSQSANIGLVSNESQSSPAQPKENKQAEAFEFQPFQPSDFLSMLTTVDFLSNDQQPLR
jgi:hypothetical protein